MAQAANVSKCFTSKWLGKFPLQGPSIYLSELPAIHLAPHLIPTSSNYKTTLCFLSFCFQFLQSKTKGKISSHHFILQSNSAKFNSFFTLQSQYNMATTTAAFTPARISGAVVSIGNTTTQKRMNKVVYVRGLNSYGGLKANNGVVSLGMPVCTEQCFANFVSSIKASAASTGNGKTGGALSAKCNKIAEIFTIAATMNGITLVGVAMGFVLLRMEAFFEELDSE